MKNWHLLIIALFTMTFSLTACGPAELGAASDDSSDECTTDKDCASDERCKPDPEGNMCVPKDDSEDPECEADSDCDRGQFCTDDGICVPDEEDPECTSDDSDCESGQVCTDEICVDEGTDECTSDDDCASDERCKPQLDGNVCVPDEEDPECTSDDDCGSGEVCEDNACVPDDSEDPECTSDADCASNEVCSDDGMCVADDDDAELYDLTCHDVTPGEQSAEYIQLSGIFRDTDGRVVYGWQEWGQVGSRSRIESMFMDVEPGMFRFSVEYKIDGSITSWDCWIKRETRKTSRLKGT